MSIDICEMCGNYVDTDYFPELYKLGFCVLKEHSIPIGILKNTKSKVHRTYGEKKIVFTKSEYNTAKICDSCWERCATEEQKEIYDGVAFGDIQLDKSYF